MFSFFYKIQKGCSRLLSSGARAVKRGARVIKRAVKKVSNWMYGHRDEIKTVINYIAIAVAIALLIYLGVYMVGFTTAGVTAGSAAAAAHSALAPIAAGSAFATLQSVGATGAILTWGIPIAIGVGLVAAFVVNAWRRRKQKGKTE